MQEVADLLEQSDFDPPPGCDTWEEASMWDADRMNAINWPKLAGDAGAPVDLEDWAAFTREKLGESA